MPFENLTEMRRVLNLRDDWGVAGSRVVATLAKVLVALILMDLWVRGPFFSGFVAPRFVSAYEVLRERTSGQNVSILIETIRRMPAGTPRVAFIGDSTMKAAEAPERSIVPYLLRAELRRRSNLPVETIDCSEIGLYGTDAALLTSRLLGAGADVVVYGLLLRALPRAPNNQWVTQLSSQLDVHDLWRFVDVGGGAWLLQNAGSERLLAGLVQSAWATYAYRMPLRLYFAEHYLAGGAPFKTAVAAFVRPRPVFGPDVAPRPPGPHAVDWPRSQYASPSANWTAVEMVGRLCQRYAPGRCVLYAGPVNPVRRTNISDPGLYEEYLASLRVLAGRYGLIWRDYTNALKAEDFRRAKYGGGPDPIHMNDQGRLKLATLLVDPVAEALRNATQATRP
jgi:hypothetical protein